MAPKEIADFIRARIWLSNQLLDYIQKLEITGFSVVSVRARGTGIPEEFYEGGTIEIGDQFVEFQLADDQAVIDEKIDISVRVTHLSNWHVGVQIICKQCNVNHTSIQSPLMKEELLEFSKQVLKNMESKLNS